MLTKNSLFTGLLAGAILPAISWFVFEDLLKDKLVLQRAWVPYLAVIAINLLILRFCFKKGADQTGRGMMLATFVFMLLVFLLKIKV